SVPMLPDPRIATGIAIRSRPSSEHRYRIHRRSRALLDAQRGDEAEELPPPLLLTGGREVFEIQAVRVVQPHRADTYRVDRVGNSLAPARDRLTVAIPADRGNAAVVQKRHDAGMQASLGRRGVPWAFVQALAGVAGAQEHDVALGQPDPGMLLGRLDLVRPHEIARLYPGGATQPRDVDQDPATDQALLRHVHRLPRCTQRVNRLIHRHTVVQQALVGHVTERVDVRVGIAVEFDPDEITGEAQIARVADVDVLQDRHVVQYRLRIVGSGAGVQRPGA